MKKTNLVKVVMIGVLSLTSVNAFTATPNEDVIIVNHDDLQTEVFKVYGNCGMCKATIEGSLKGVDGIKTAIWNKDTKMMEVIFDSHKISLKEIKEKIAEVGYDTDAIRASKKSYNNLPGCCQYERPTEGESHEGHSHSH